MARVGAVRCGGNPSRVTRNGRVLTRVVFAPKFVGCAIRSKSIWRVVEFEEACIGSVDGQRGAEKGGGSAEWLLWLEELFWGDMMVSWCNPCDRALSIIQAQRR